MVCLARMRRARRDRIAPGHTIATEEETMRPIIVLLLSLFASGCFPYVYHSQDRVLIPGVDIGATLGIARAELEEGGFDATLAIWAIRDQVVSTNDARTIAELYFSHIDRLAGEKERTTADFGVWHFAWAIANLYRNGDDSVRAALQPAYSDAKERPETLKHFRGAAREHVNGQKIYMGDIHAFARSFARSHIVAPGNRRYLQSVDEYWLAKGER